MQQYTGNLQPHILTEYSVGANLLYFFGITLYSLSPRAPTTTDTFLW